MERGEVVPDRDGWAGGVPARQTVFRQRRLLCVCQALQRGRAGLRAAAGDTAAVTAPPGNAGTASLTEPAMAWRGRSVHLWNGDAGKPNKSSDKNTCGAAR